MSYLKSSARRSAVVRSTVFVVVLTLLLLLSGLVATSGSAYAEGGPVTETGVLNGAAYRIDMPATWNGTLLLYSHGYRIPGSANPANSVEPQALSAILLAQGYALAGSAYSTTGWAVEQAIPEQVALLNYFEGKYGKPTRTVAWGFSLGGMITAAIAQQYPERIQGALPMCGVVGGGVGAWNVGLAGGVAFKTLVAPTSNLDLVNIGDPTQNLMKGLGALEAAQQTPQGRARIALAAALADVPGWFDPASPAPAPTDYAAQEQNQYLWLKNVTLPFQLAFRKDLELRAGGNPSWTNDVDFRDLLARSADRAQVEALYQAAGLSLDADLQAIQQAPPIFADQNAVDYLTANVTYNGRITVPVLTMHTTGDGLVVVQNERAYRDIVAAAGNSSLLRQIYVDRAGHCQFTGAEVLTALGVLMQRVQTGVWPDTSNVAALNAAAAGLGPILNNRPSAFIAYEPSPYLRPYTLPLWPVGYPRYGVSMLPVAAGGPDGAAMVAQDAPGFSYTLTMTISGLAPGSVYAVDIERGRCDLGGPAIQALPNAVADWQGVARIRAHLGFAEWLAIHTGPASIHVYDGSAPSGDAVSCGNVP